MFNSSYVNKTFFVTKTNIFYAALNFSTLSLTDKQF